MNNNNRMQIYPSDAMQIIIDKLPKGTKSKFINLCVEKVISDVNLRNQVLAQLIGFDSIESTPAHSSQTQPEEQDTTSSPEPKKISAATITFNK
ncbi:MAG TPA: hypothetical protein PLP75_01500 [Burkholderiales bacterium]|nr:hypothetical protein [Burkholderiales bacterium]